MKFRYDVVGLIVVLVVLGAIGYADRMLRVPSSVYSTFDSGPNGYRALFEVLHAARVPAGRLTRPLGQLGAAVSTLIVSGYEGDPSAKPLDSKDAAALRRFVASGGRLVALDERFAGATGAIPAVPATVVRQAHDDRVAVAIARGSFTNSVRWVVAPVEAVFSFGEARGVPLLANSGGIVAMAYRFGRGEVIAVTAPPIFANAYLRKGDNLRFAYDVVATHGPVLFDEYVHGYDDEARLWSVVPASVHGAVWIVALLGILWLIGSLAPFAPPAVEAGAQDRHTASYIGALAELMARSRRRDSDAEVLAQAHVDFSQWRSNA